MAETNSAVGSPTNPSAPACSLPSHSATFSARAWTSGHGWRCHDPSDSVARKFELAVIDSDSAADRELTRNPRSGSESQ